jgi:hypothetical protein
VDNLRKEEIQDKSGYFNLKKRHLLQIAGSLSDWVASEKGGKAASNCPGCPMAASC